MLGYFFSKAFGILERNSNSLKKIPNIEKQIIHTEEAHDSYYVMTLIPPLPPYKTLLRSCGYNQVYILLIFKPNIMVNRKT